MEESGVFIPIHDRLVLSPLFPESCLLSDRQRELGPHVGAKTVFYSGKCPGLFKQIKQVNDKLAVIVMMWDKPVRPFPNPGSKPEGFFFPAMMVAVALRPGSGCDQARVVVGKKRGSRSHAFSNRKCEEQGMEVDAETRRGVCLEAGRGRHLRAEFGRAESHWVLMKAQSTRARFGGSRRLVHVKRQSERGSSMRGRLWIRALKSAASRRSNWLLFFSCGYLMRLKSPVLTKGLGSRGKRQTSWQGNRRSKRD